LYLAENFISFFNDRNTTYQIWIFHMKNNTPVLKLRIFKLKPFIMKNIYYFVILAVLITFRLAGFSQNGQEKVYRIQTRDGNIFTGYIVNEDSVFTFLKTEILGELKIPNAEIKSKSEIIHAKKVDDEYWLPNPQSTRYFWAPNGYGLKKDEAWYQNIWILYNQFSYGFTNNFSCGIGFVPLFLFAGTSTPVWIVPKFSIPVAENKFNIGTGALVGTLIGEDSGVAGLLYGTATAGSPDKNLSFGMAYGFVGSEWSQIPIFNLSGMTRIGPNSYLLIENYIIPIEGEVAGVIWLGGRTIVRNIGIDYSLMIPIGMEIGDFVAAPFLGITIPLNRKAR
jgi:hypothetical protein